MTLPRLKRVGFYGGHAQALDSDSAVAAHALPRCFGVAVPPLRTDLAGRAGDRHFGAVAVPAAGFLAGHRLLPPGQHRGAAPDVPRVRDVRPV